MNAKQHDTSYAGIITQITPYIIPLFLFLMAFILNSYAETANLTADTNAIGARHGSNMHGVGSAVEELPSANTTLGKEDQRE